MTIRIRILRCGHGWWEGFKLFTVILNCFQAMENNKFSYVE